MSDVSGSQILSVEDFNIQRKSPAILSACIIFSVIKFITFWIEHRARTFILTSFFVSLLILPPLPFFCHISYVLELYVNV